MSRVLDLMAQEGMLVAPGVGDALGALLVVEAGFRAVYMSGYQVSATLGHPDVGLVTMSEMVDRARSIAEAVEVPLITDADTGYGSAVNVTRTVRAFERAGVAGIHLEDQVSPKKCGAMAGRALVPIPEMTGKIKAALDARRSDEPTTGTAARPTSPAPSWSSSGRARSPSSSRTSRSRRSAGP